MEYLKANNVMLIVCGCRYQQASSHAVTDPDRALEITIAVDDKAKTFTIQVLETHACADVHEHI